MGAARSERDRDRSGRHTRIGEVGERRTEAF